MLDDRVILKEDRAFTVSDLSGHIPIGNTEGLGLYSCDTRFLSGYELRLNGRLPILLSNSVGRAYVATFQLVNDTLEGDAGEIPRQSISIRRTRFMHRGLHERIGFVNCNREPVDVVLELRFAADFRDIFDVRGYYHPSTRGVARRGQATETGIRFAYSGADGVDRVTEVVVNPEPVEVTPSRVVLRLHLEPHTPSVVLVDVISRFGLDEAVEEVFEFEASLESLERTFAGWNDSCTTFRSDNEVLDRGVLWRSQEDLRVLCDDPPTGLYPTAGVPWYAVPFGRDGLVTALQTLALNPDLARGTLRYLAAHQGRRDVPSREEEPGKILHEIRFGELSRLHVIPHTPYYGTVDATPLFVVLLVELMAWSGDVDLLSELLPNVIAALEWIDHRGDSDGDGFVEYQNHGRGGVRNQGWKDSADSLLDDSGRPAPLPARLVEVQAYCHHAKAGLARVLRARGRRSEADALERQAQELRRRFDTAFWMPDLQFYAQAIDGEGRQVPWITSNPGHGLLGGIYSRERAAAVVGRLMAGDMFSGWGVRTLSESAPQYNPMSYHNGSVWPHDNSLIAAGMARSGHGEAAEAVARSVLEAGMRFPDDRLPELFCGFHRDSRFGSGPGEYLVSCSPQAWGAGAAFHLLQVLAGVEPDVLEGVIRIRPLDTSLYRRLTIEGMRVGDGFLDLTVTCGEGPPRVSVGRRPHGLRIEAPT